MTTRAIFLDKDGTLVKDIPYNVDPSAIVLTAHALEALKLLQQAGYRLVIVTNQSGVARGFFPEQAVHTLQSAFERIFSDAGLKLDGFYYCPHYLEGSVVEYAIACDCRKPAPGMLLRAAVELNITPHASWMIGDILNDIEAGHRAGSQAILINNGNETEWEFSPLRRPDFQAKDLLEAAEYIIKCSR
jgi:D,D-heptose 1,7-bisphosphate phosphatase